MNSAEEELRVSEVVKTIELRRLGLFGCRDSKRQFAVVFLKNVGFQLEVFVPAVPSKV